MEQHLNSINWNDFICHNPSAVLAWSAFIDLLRETIDKFVPHFVTRVQPGKHKPQPREIRKLVSKKRGLWRKLRKIRLTYIYNGSIVTVYINIVMLVIDLTSWRKCK